jgi:hypothetical protein
MEGTAEACECVDVGDERWRRGTGRDELHIRRRGGGAGRVPAYVGLHLDVVGEAPEHLVDGPGEMGRWGEGKCVGRKRGGQVRERVGGAASGVEREDKGAGAHVPDALNLLAVFVCKQRRASKGAAVT